MALASETSVTATVASGAFLGANPRRVGVIVSAPAANPVTISKAGTAVANVGIVLRAGTAPVVLRDSDLGDWLQMALTCISVGGSETLGVVEVLEP